MMILDKPVVFQIDSGASINIAPLKYLKYESIETTSKTLQMWNGSAEKAVGTTEDTESSNSENLQSQRHHSW